MIWVVIDALRIDPDLGVFDLETEPRLGAFVVAGEHPPDGLGDLSGGRIDALGGRVLPPEKWSSLKYGF